MNILTRAAAASQARPADCDISNACLVALHEAIGRPLPLPLWHSRGARPLTLRRPRSLLELLPSGRR